MVVVWASANNILGVDFNLYSSWADLVAGTNPWPACNYDDFANYIGAFRDCAPGGLVGGMWISRVSGSSNNNNYMFQARRARSCTRCSRCGRACR